MTRVTSNPEQTRQTIRDAMRRLLEGKPIRSDGKLTIKSLADEAAVKRWILTHQYRDLQQEFRDRVDNQGATPDSVRNLVKENEALRSKTSQMKEKIRDLTEEVHRFTRIVQVLTLENLQMRDKLGKQGEKVRHLR